MADPRETTSDAIGKAASVSEKGLEQGRETVRRGFSAGLEAGRRTMDEASGRAEQLTRGSAQNMEAMLDASTVFASAAQNISHEWMELFEERLRSNTECLGRMIQCRSLGDAFRLQGELLQDNWKQVAERTRRIAEIQLDAANKATKAFAGRFQQGAEQVQRLA